MFQDRYGLPLTATHPDAAARYRAGVDLLLSAWPGADAAFAAALRIDPACALARAGLARALQVQGRGGEARVEMAKAAKAGPVHPREASHIAALAKVVAGDGAGALALIADHLDHWPRDAMVLAPTLGAFGLFAFGGRADHDRARVEICQRLAAAFGEDWWFLYGHGWALTEAGDTARGLELSLRALDLRAAHANGVHAVAHAYHELGDKRAAAELLDRFLPTYPRIGGLHAHLVWHRALIAIADGEMVRARSLYDRELAPDVSLAPPINLVTDAASLLWRLRARGMAGLDWAAVTAAAERAFPRVGIAFVDLHCLLAAASAGDRDAVERRLTALDLRQAAGEAPAGPVVTALARAVCARAAGDDAEPLGPLAAEIVRIGGSGAQREMFEALAG